MKKITSHTTDEELMNLYLQAHAPAFDELYNRHAGKILGYLKKKVSGETAEELLQDVFVRLHVAKTTYNENYLFLPWIFTIARNALFDYFKKAETRITANAEELSENLLSPSSAENTFNVDSQLYLNILSPEQRKVFELRYLKDWSFEQIAKTTATSPTNVRQIISRGIKKMKSVKASEL